MKLLRLTLLNMLILLVIVGIGILGMMLFLYLLNRDAEAIEGVLHTIELSVYWSPWGIISLTVVSFVLAVLEHKKYIW